MTQTPTVPHAAGPWRSALADRDTAGGWGMVLILGALSLAFGLAILAWPDTTLRVMAALVGVWLFLAGIARIIGAFLPGDVSIGRHILSGIVGVIVLIAGVACLRNVVTSLAVLALMVAMSWILSGLTLTVWAMQATGSTRAWLFVAGLLSVVVGMVMLFTPGLTLKLLVWLMGLGAIAVGVTELILAFMLRKAKGQAATQRVEPSNG